MNVGKQINSHEPNRSNQGGAGGNPVRCLFCPNENRSREEEVEWDTDPHRWGGKYTTAEHAVYRPLLKLRNGLSWDPAFLPHGSRKWNLYAEEMLAC